MNQRLTQHEQEQLNDMARIRAAREDYLSYLHYIEPAYKSPDHLVLLASMLQAVERGDIPRLIVTMPPQHGKTYTSTERFPSWCLGRNPDWRVMIASYNKDKAEEPSGINRDIIMESDAFRKVFPNVFVDPKQTNKAKWKIQGQRYTSVKAAGVGGGLTGGATDLIMIDDPVKDDEEAQSPTQRRKVWEWYKKVIHSRLGAENEDKSASRIVVIMTRWHEEDLAGKLLSAMEESGEDWVVLHIPALSFGLEEDYRREGMSEQDYLKATEGLPKDAFPDPLGRHKDEPLWPEIGKTVKWLRVRQSMDPHAFNCLYQGHPKAPQGEKLKRHWFRAMTMGMLKDLKPKRLQRARSYDLAWSESQEADKTVGLKASLYKRENESLCKELNIPPVIFLIQDVQYWREEWDRTSTNMLELAKLDGRWFDILIEAVASQNKGFKSLKNNPGMRARNIIPIVPDRDKSVRGKNTILLGSWGSIFVLYPSPSEEPEWLTDFLDEVCGFPYAAHDDFYDALTQIVNYWFDEIDNLMIDLMMKENTIKGNFEAWKEEAFLGEVKPVSDIDGGHLSHLPFELRPKVSYDSVYNGGWD